MATLPEEATWTDNGIYQLELDDFITGGPGGNDNEPHRILANRTRFLKQQLDGKSPTNHTHPYLPSNGKAVDSDKLGGLPLLHVRPQLLYKHADPSSDLSTTYVVYMNTWFVARGEVCLFTGVCSVDAIADIIMNIHFKIKLWNYTKQRYEGVDTETIMTIRDLYNSAQLVNSIGHSSMVAGDAYVIQFFVKKSIAAGPINLKRIAVTGISQ